MVPILAYHQIADDDVDVSRVPVGDRPYCLSAAVFVEQMTYLSEQGYIVMSLDSLASALQHKTALPSHVVVITFDDGHVSNYTHALPLLRARRWTATFFIVTGRVRQEGNLNWKQVREMQESGMTMGSHTVSHPFLSQLSQQEIRRELEQSRQTLENTLQTTVTSLAVPYGYEPDGLSRMAEFCGYRTVCNSHLGLVGPGADVFHLPRVTVRRGCSLDTFARLVRGEPVTLLRFKTFEALKNLGKRGLGLRRWLAVREFLLSLKR